MPSICKKKILIICMSFLPPMVVTTTADQQFRDEVDPADPDSELFLAVEEVEATMRPGHVLEYGRYLLIEKIDPEFYGPLLDSSEHDEERALPGPGPFPPAGVDEEDDPEGMGAPPRGRARPKFMVPDEFFFEEGLWTDSQLTAAVPPNMCGKDELQHRAAAPQQCPAEEDLLGAAGTPHYRYSGGHDYILGREGSPQADSMFRRRGLQLPYAQVLEGVKASIGLPPRKELLSPQLREQSLRLPWSGSTSVSTAGASSSIVSRTSSSALRRSSSIALGDIDDDLALFPPVPVVLPSDDRGVVSGGVSSPIRRGNMFDDQWGSSGGAGEHHHGHGGDHFDPDEDMYAGSFSGSTRFGRGAYGEVWRAVEMRGDQYREVVLKRLFSEKGEYVTKSGEREIFFGIKLKYAPHVARYLDHFHREEQLWLVFLNEGYSLRHLLWWIPPAEEGMKGGDQHSQLVPSPFWWSLKGATGGAAAARGTAGGAPGGSSSWDRGDHHGGTMGSASTSVDLFFYRDMYRDVMTPAPYVGGDLAPVGTTYHEQQSYDSSSGGGPLVPTSGELQTRPPSSSIPGGTSPAGTSRLPASWKAWLSSLPPGHHPHQLFPPTVSGIQQIKSLMYQLLHGLAEMHAVNITHRDIKPSNLLVRESLFPLSTASMDDRNEFGWERNVHSGDNRTTPSEPTGRSATGGGRGGSAGGGAAGGMASAGGDPMNGAQKILLAPNLHLRVADLGSAVLLEEELPEERTGSTEEQRMSSKRLYGNSGPSADEETPDYRPPEAYILDAETARKRAGNDGGYQVPGAAGPRPPNGRAMDDEDEDSPMAGDEEDPKPLPNPYFRGPAYDIFGAGLCFLEIVTGRPSSEIFQIRQDPTTPRQTGPQPFSSTGFLHHDPRKQRLLHLRYTQMGYSDLEIRSALKVHSFMDSCVRPATTSCSDDVFRDLLEALDLAGEGLPDPLARDLLRRMLQWEPESRISAPAALQHPWFGDDFPGRRGGTGGGSTSPAWAGEEEEEEEEELLGDGVGPGDDGFEGAAGVVGATEEDLAGGSTGSPASRKRPSLDDGEDHEQRTSSTSPKFGPNFLGPKGTIVETLTSTYLVQGLRPSMEDGLGTETVGPFLVCGVFDGHYGAEVAFALRDHFFSQFLNDRLWDVLRGTTTSPGTIDHDGAPTPATGGAAPGAASTDNNMNFRERMKSALRSALLAFDEWIRAEQEREGQTGGSTVSLVVLDKRSATLYTAQIGDSEVHKISRTVDHSASTSAGARASARETENQPRYQSPNRGRTRRRTESEELRQAAQAGTSAPDEDSSFQLGQKVLVIDTGELGKIENIRVSPNLGKKLYLVQLQERSSEGKSTKFFREYQLKPRVPGLRVSPLVQLHKPDPKAATTIIASDGLPRVGGKLATSRSVGRLPEGLKAMVPSEPDVAVHELAGPTPKSNTRIVDDFLIVGSDGLFDELPARECAEIVHSVLRAGVTSVAELYSAVKLLVDTALDRGSGDNISVVLVKLLWHE